MAKKRAKRVAYGYYRDEYVPRIKRLKRGEVIYLIGKRVPCSATMQNLVTGSAAHHLGKGRLKTRQIGTGLLEVKRIR